MPILRFGLCGLYIPQNLPPEWEATSHRRSAWDWVRARAQRVTSNDQYDVVIVTLETGRCLDTINPDTDTTKILGIHGYILAQKLARSTVCVGAIGSSPSHQWLNTLLETAIGRTNRQARTFVKGYIEPGSQQAQHADDQLFADCKLVVRPDTWLCRN